MFKTLPKIIVTTAVWTVVFGSSDATTLDNLGGYVNLSQVRSKFESGTTSTDFRQEYRAHWQERFSEYLRLEAAYNYNDLEQKQAEQVGLWRIERLPSLRASFAHPQLAITSTLQELRTTGLVASNDLTRKSFEIGMRTRSLSIPILSANYTRLHHIGQPGENGKNFLEKRLSFSAVDNFDNLELRYNFNRTENDNKVTLLESISSSHQFRGTMITIGAAGGKFNNSTTYQLDYSRRTDRLPASETLYHGIPITSALYLDQGDPLTGALDVFASLNDGDRLSPTDPRIPIGAGQTGRQIGVDLGNVRAVSALYIYCDVISDPSLQWGVYVSEDNFNWEVHDFLPLVVFNTVDNRYEIEFDSVHTQYIKVVNRGFNQVDSIFVTEIEAFQAVVTDGELSQSYTSHLAYISSAYKATDRLGLYSDITYQREPAVGLVGRQDNFFATTRATYRLSEVTTNSLILQQNYQLYNGGAADVTDYSLQYNLRYEPWSTLNMTWSAVGRISNFDHERNSEDINLSWKGTGRPLTELTVRLGTAYARNRRLLLDQTSNTVTRQISAEGDLTGSIVLSAGYDNLHTTIRETDRSLSRDRYNAGATWRFTSTILLQVMANWSRGDYRYESVDFLGNWRLSSTISVSGILSRTINSDNSRTNRKSFAANWRISNRVGVYMSYIDNDFSQIGREESSSLQFGLRASI